MAGTSGSTKTVDVVIVGAGFSGMYLLHRLRALGLSVQVLEAGGDVGGTWYWNRYPGARVDIQSVEYSMSFDPQLEKDWKWSEKFSPQPELLRYAQHISERYDLRRDIRFDTRVAAANWDDDRRRWMVRTAAGDAYDCRWYVMATGCLSVPKEIDIDGTDRFRGPTYLTGRWPHEPIDFTGKRVAVIGTGSSAIQSIPVIAQTAGQVTVFQRTANFSIPANNGPVPKAVLDDFWADRDAFREAERWSGSGVKLTPATVSALSVSDEERNATYEMAWERGGISEFLSTYTDHLLDPRANELLAEFVRNKIRSTVKDPETAETLCPKTFPIGTKRLCVDTNYYATFNLPHVRLIDINKHPLQTVTETGVQLADEHIEFDIIVFATGFDAMTGAMVSVDITGKNGRTLKQEWEHGPVTYLGLTAEGFPNLFMVTGPGSPSVLSNMLVSIEQHVDWITDCIKDLREAGLDTIEPTKKAVDGWVRHSNDCANITLMPQANSWYMGANVPGKTRIFLPYAGGVDRYRKTCDEVRAKGYLGFVRRGSQGNLVNDGLIRELQPDIAIMLDIMGTLGLPPMESMSPVEAREFSKAMSAVRPTGPEVGEILDGTLPGPRGPLDYRLFRPATPGPHPVLLYFHGGGWVFGDQTSDDPFCRDICDRTDAIVISANYGHGPEERFPAAVHDAYAALIWVSEHLGELGGRAGALAVAGWSAGGNLAAVAAQMARDNGGPALAGQLLVTPVTDGSKPYRSHYENGDGYILTDALMKWFWGHYATEEQRRDPKASPLLASSLAGLPPTMIVTSQFDPLRDEGDAYAAALSAAGVKVRHLQARGHTHTSLTSVGMVFSGAPIRAEMAAAVRGFFGAKVPA